MCECTHIMYEVHVGSLPSLGMCPCTSMCVCVFVYDLECVQYLVSVNSVLSYSCWWLFMAVPPLSFACSFRFTLVFCCCCATHLTVYCTELVQKQTACLNRLPHQRLCLSPGGFHGYVCGWTVLPAEQLEHSGWLPGFCVFDWHCRVHGGWGQDPGCSESTAAAQNIASPQVWIRIFMLCWKSADMCLVFGIIFTRKNFFLKANICELINKLNSRQKITLFFFLSPLSSLQGD